MTTEQTLRESYGRRITASLASSMGAAAIGVGVGSILPGVSVAVTILFLLAGSGIHIGGMVIAHRADAEAAIVPPSWHQALTIACWLGLLGFAVLTTVPFIL